MTSSKLIQENKKRIMERDTPYNPITGEGAPLERKLIEIVDYYLPKQYVPVQMLEEKLIKAIIKAGSIIQFLKDLGEDINIDNRRLVGDTIIGLRNTYDFFYWAASFAKIKNKEGGGNIPFVLNRPQRRLILRLEKMRLAGKPIRLILLKARQWGGSTAIQIYMAWIQLVHREGWYSAIVAQDNSSAIRIKEMYSKLLKEYPVELLGLPKGSNAIEFGSYGGSKNDYILKQGGKVVRDSVVSIGSVISPDAIRSGDIAMVHFSEVGIWKETPEWNADKIIRTVSGAILNKPNTIIVYESTANGTGNFFHTEWLRANKPDGDPEKSSMDPLFVPWFEIEIYQKEFESEQEKIKFADWLIDNRDNEKPNGASDPGTYYWWLWTIGATLENINWYIDKRRELNSHADMAAEFPSDDIEAFKHSGRKIFDLYKLEELRKGCMAPEFIGDVSADFQTGKKAFQNLHFVPNERGNLLVWEMPDKEQIIADRYIVIVDPQKGKSDSADPSCITVIDRYWLMHGGVESVVAEWHGPIDKDLLAWKSAQVAKLYNNALLVIERNTFDNEKGKAMDEGEFIIDQISEAYDNMYIYVPMGKVREKQSTSYGWFTNGTTKPAIVNKMIAIIREAAYTERSNDAIDEFTYYERKEDGNWGAMEKKHDERVITRMIGLFISREQMDKPREQAPIRTTVKAIRTKKY
ncbi:terminase [Petrimonas sp.]|uniref:terminase n=1 Tax=Petrimonas sp. TaxID=2023866 RepID=UPI002FC7651C